MKRFSALWLSLLLTSFAMGAQEGRFMRYPDINGSTIVFTYESDLWLVSADGGTARRITSAPGVEFAAKFSPDGKWIAFTGTYDGIPSVYLIPSDGGMPTRLTYVPGNVRTVGWSPDGQKIIFRSMYEQVNARDPALYYVSRNGSAPERLPLDRGLLCSFSPDGKSMLYARKGAEEYYWKRYKGGDYMDIWRYDFDTKAFTPITDYVGKNAYPMWIGTSMYYVSDRTNGISNLYAQDLATKSIRQLTTYDTVDLMMPSTDGKRIVYLNDGYLHIFDIASGTARKIQVEIASDQWYLRERTINPKDYIHHVDASNDGKKVLIEARGDLYVSPTDKGSTRNLSDSPGTREMYPALSPDGKWVAFFSDKTGEYQLYMQSVEGGEWIPLTTSLDRTNYHALWSPDGKKLLFGNKDLAIFVLDINSKKLTKVDESRQLRNDEFTWEMSDYVWSPDSKWIAYTQSALNRNNQVFLYSLEQSKRFTVASDFYDNLSPAFDADGDFLYFLSSRNFDVSMDYTEDNYVLRSPYQIMAVQLRASEPPPFLEKSAEPRKSSPPFRIDTDGLQTRVYPLPVQAGNYFHLRAGKGSVLWVSVDQFNENEYEQFFNFGTSTKWQLHLYNLEGRNEVVLPEKIRMYQVSTNGEQVVIWREGDLYVSSVANVESSKAPGKKVSLEGMTYRVDTQAEWNQIFSDTWRWYRDFFYDPGMHGHDWKAMGEHYRSYIPWLSSREDLNWVLSQMVGELCVSHTYIGGGDYGPRQAPSTTLFTGWLGADLVADAKSGYYRFGKIYGPTEHNASLTGPLVRPDIDVHEGDYLLAINGDALRVPDDFNKMLQIVQGQKVTITVSRSAKQQEAKTYEVTPIRYDGRLRYFRWVTDNINYVLKNSGGKIGYMHITAMGSGGLSEFDKYWRAFKYKDGIIIDVRRNSGGWVEYFLIDKLERKVTSFNVLKNMIPFRYPGTASTAHYVALSNENNGSDGEAFIEDFKDRKLGTVIGTPSWGGLVGILNGQTTIDNGNVQQSNNAFYGREGKWLVENHGADPDILLDNDPASVMDGKDLQLDKAIEVLLQKIKDEPFTFPPQPPYPKK
jgi:tricorn protease